MSRPQDRHPLTGKPVSKGDTSKADAAAGLIGRALAGRGEMGILGGKGKGDNSGGSQGGDSKHPKRVVVRGGKGSKRGSTSGKGKNKGGNGGGGEGRGPKGDE